MMIDRIGATDPILPGKKASKTENVRSHIEADSDSVSVSTEAAEKGDLYRAIELVSSAEDVRADRIAELKQKINDPTYLNDKLISDTADQLMTAFGL
jgi:negative regulator of flagellin synthesis FlgM